MGVPPCYACKHTELDPGNETVFRLWAVCHQFGRDGVNGSMLGAFVLELCREYGETRKTFERILSFESTVYPLLRAKDEQK